nr:CAP domain-containing protein [Phytoactinopolyspora alkaliphila]
MSAQPSAARDTTSSADRSGESDGQEPGRPTSSPQPPPSSPPTQPPDDAEPTTNPTPRPTEPTATPTTHHQPPNYTPSAPPPPRPTVTESRSPRPEPTSEPPRLTRAEQRALDATNNARRHAGCPDLRVDAKLTAAARQHSADMRERGYYSHISPDGAGPSDRAKAAGYPAPVGENIARGLLGGRYAVNAWLSRSESRAKIADCEFVSVGFGAETGVLTTWWTQLLGTQ